MIADFGKDRRVVLLEVLQHVKGHFPNRRIPRNGVFRRWQGGIILIASSPLGDIDGTARQGSQQDSQRCLIIVVVDHSLGICIPKERQSTLGQSGIHYQPFDAMAASLRRDHSEFFGGMLIFVPTDKVDNVTALVLTVGLEATLWDNGTPYRPEGVAG